LQCYARCFVRGSKIGGPLAKQAATLISDCRVAVASHPAVPAGLQNGLPAAGGAAAAVSRKRKG
jgi:hypothetical protein